MQSRINTVVAIARNLHWLQLATCIMRIGKHERMVTKVVSVPNRIRRLSDDVNHSTGIWDSISFASVHHLAKAGAVAVPTSTARVAALGSPNCFKSCAAVGDPRCSGTSNVSRCSSNIGASASGAPNPSNPPDCPCEPWTSPPLSICRPCAHRTRCQ